MLCSVAVALLCAPPFAAGQDLYDDSMVREIRISFAQPDWQALLEQNVKSDTDIPATVTVDGTRLDSVGVRYKGHSSFNVPGDKKPFNITTDAFRKGQQLWGHKVFNLNNFFKDPTCVREMVGYQMAARYLFAAKAAYVRLFINDTYWGLYLNVQQLSGTFLRDAFGDASGNHYKGDPRGDLVWQGPDTATYRANYELKTNEDRNDWSDLVGFIEKLNSLPPNRFHDEISALIDVDRVLWYLAFCNIMVNLDSYIGSGHNYYLYHFPVDDRFHIIPWDLNEVLGTFSQQLTIQQREQLPILYGQSNPARPLVAKMLADPDFRRRYIAHYRTIQRESFTPEYWSPRIQAYQDLVRDNLAADTKKLYPMDLFTRNVAENVQSNVGGPAGGLIPGIFSMINNRRTYLASLPEMNDVQPVIGATVQHPASPTNEDTVVVEANVTGAVGSNLWWSIGRMAFRKVVMSTAGGGRYIARIPAQAPFTDIRYYIEAVSPSNVYRYNPERAEKEFLGYSVQLATRQSPVVINEVMAGNSSTVPDPQGQYDDWIELYNTATQSVDIGGMYLTDDVGWRTRWMIPEGTAIPGGGYLLIWADGDTADTPGLHANFKLNKDGEGLYLFAPLSSGVALVDSITFGRLEGEITWGRYPNGAGPFRVLKPTPGTVNELATGIGNPPPVSPLLPELSLYPNPVASGRLVVRIGFPHGTRVRLCLYDVYGRPVGVARETVVLSSGFQLAMNVSGLRAGTYFLLADSDGMIRHAMFTVTR